MEHDRMSELIGTDAPMTPETEATLRALAGTIIPASSRHGVPGADDPKIFNDLLISAGSALEFLNESMRSLDEQSGSGGFNAQSPAQRLALAEQFRASQPEAAGLLVSLISQCYYRDDRVMASLDMDPRPPFPEGFDIADGDWSLLDPVRARGIVYREVPV
jgi:hypothetical protein